jgi:ribosomal small subunit protein bTHX
MKTLLLLRSQITKESMGKGDKKTKKGKIWRDSYGNSRKKKALKAKLRRTASKKATPAAAASETSAKPKRTAPKKKDA